MTQYNTSNIKLSNSQLNKSKSGIKNGNETTTFKISSNVVGDSNDRKQLHKLLLTKAQVSKHRKAFKVFKNSFA